MKRGIFLSFVVLFMAMLTAVMIVSKPDEQDFVNWLSAEDHEHTFTCLLPDCSKLSLVLPGDGGSGSMEFVLKKSLYDPGISNESGTENISHIMEIIGLSFQQRAFWGRYMQMRNCLTIHDDHKEK
ncbi:hypothetical protein EDD68_104101 [Melghiribacillus thermohalophilus]|uniref:Uncharacterized protein n=1 Tax=Melghiribacillus thermohalophilus TaxID=1324956 RepID=A0A4V2V2G4_9BACI|nr:hypothetical protein [Melghiribacillus thermohalophilus]TCT25032.1 hypothetical protein EDD68_104101 [Melghiribacillus thermohalophilus]